MALGDSIASMELLIGKSVETRASVVHGLLVILMLSHV